MHASDNKTKGKEHALFLNQNPEVKKAKKAWVQVAQAHMQNYYGNTHAGPWSVESINNKGVDTILKWEPYSGDANAKYIRLHAQAIWTHRLCVLSKDSSIVTRMR